MLRTVPLGSSTSWYVTKYLCVLLAVSYMCSAATPPSIHSVTCRNPLTDPASTCSASTSISNDSLICREGIVGGRKTLANFFKVFRENPILDLIFVVDRSESISCKQYQCSLDLMKRLMQYISSTGDLVIGDQHSHAAILTFGVIPDLALIYDGVGIPQLQAERLTSCNLESKFPEVIYASYDNVLSKILLQAESVFKSGNKVRNTQDIKRVMLFVSEGVITVEADDANEIANRIREMPVTILGMGQDNGQMSRERENLMKSISDDSEHYACRYYWNEALLEVERLEMKTDPVYVRADGIETRSCAKDKCEYDCACEVISNTYQCHDLPPLPTASVAQGISLLSTIGIAGTAVFFIIIITLGLIFSFHKEIEILTFVKFGIRLRKLKRFGDNDTEPKEYDAFVSFNQSDSKFVIDEVMPHLEAKENFKLCVHFRDFLGGITIADNISNAINRSQRTIILLSREFLESSWCHYEFQQVHYKVMREGQGRLLVILMEDIQPKDIHDQAMKSYIKTHTYLHRHEKLFWEKLVFNMPEPGTMVSSNAQNELFNITDSQMLAMTTPV